MIELWFDRAVAIEAPAAAGQSGRRGSGYMVAPGIVLTALHVVIGSGRVGDGPAPACRVGLLADILDRGGWDVAACAADLAWPPAGTGVDDCDVALLRVTAPLTGNMQACDPLPVLETRVECQVAGCGQPEFVKALRDTEEKGEGFWTFRGRIGDRLDVGDTLADFALRDQRAPDPQEWRGASGAALVVEEPNALVGVLVHADHTGYAAIKGDVARPLVVECIAAFAKRADFRNVVQLPVVTRADLERRRGVPRFVISRASSLLPQLDRTEQSIALKRSLRPGPPTCAPVVLMAKMREYDRPDLFLQTVANHLATTFMERRCCYQEPKELPWDKELAPDEAVAALKTHLPGAYEAWDDAVFDELLRGGQKPRLYAVRIDSDIQPPTTEAFEALLNWWSERAACEGGPATLLLSVIESTDTPNGPPCPHAAAILEAAKPFFAGRARCRLPSLKLCTLKDFNDWDSAVLRATLGVHGATIAAHLNRAATQAGNTVPLKVYAEALRDMDLAG